MRSADRAGRAGRAAVVACAAGSLAAIGKRSISLSRQEVPLDADGDVVLRRLRGPFAECHERFGLTPTQDGSLLVHTGTFSLRGGLWGWLFGTSVVKPAFDAHVREHMLETRAELALDLADP